MCEKLKLIKNLSTTILWNLIELYVSDFSLGELIDIDIDSDIIETKLGDKTCFIDMKFSIDNILSVVPQIHCELTPVYKTIIKDAERNLMDLYLLKMHSDNIMESKL